MSAILDDVWANGARLRRKTATKLAHAMIPAMPVPSSEEESVKREAYELAKTHRHKPWARRYLRGIKESFHV